MTEAEKNIWYRLRAHYLVGASFRRQFPIGPYIVDFICLEHRLIIEIGGGQHAENQRDIVRQTWLQSQGFTVLRLWNNDILLNIDGVLEKIADTLRSQPPPSLTLPRKGEGNRPARGAI